MKAAEPFLVAVLLCVAGTNMPALAADWPTKPYDLTYTVTTPTGTSQTRMATDGKGKVLTVSEVANTKVTSVCDYPARICYSIMEAQKMVYKMRLQDTQTAVVSDEAAKKLNAKSLGMKVIDGHPCKGWQYIAPGSTTETWVAVDLEAAVRSTTKTAQGTTTMVLKSVSTKAPDPKVFAIPAGYKVMEASQ